MTSRTKSTTKSKISNSLTSQKGFIDIEKLFYCAQKNYIEKFVLGIGADQ